MHQTDVHKPASLATLKANDLYRMQVRELRGYAMFMLDLEGILISWNAGVESIIGYSEQEWIGRHACMIFTPAEQAAEVCESEMRRARETGSATDIRWHRTKSGTEFFAHGSMTAIRDEHGALIGYSKIVSDETARKQLQDALTESNAALEQFAYVASHDLQEPLRTMSAYSQLLTKRYGGMLDADGNKFLNFILNASSRMGTLVRDLLDYARLRTEIQRPASVALDEDLEAALTHLEQAIAESGASITHDPLPVLPVDPGQIIRLFQNLVGNAIKYRKPDQPPTIHISAEQKGAEWILSIRDNGIGFEPKHALGIFEPFKRLHTGGEYPGSGVGLAICQRIVQAQRGRIWAESQLGEGAIFRFTLPVESAPPPQHTPPIDSPPSDSD